MENKQFGNTPNNNLVPIGLGKPYETIRQAPPEQGSDSEKCYYRAALGFKTAYEQELAFSSEYLESAKFWEIEFNRLKEENLKLKASEYKGPGNRAEMEVLSDKARVLAERVLNLTNLMASGPIRLWYDLVQPLRESATDLNDWLRLKGLKK